LGTGEVSVAVAVAQCVELGCLQKAIERVLADRLEQPVAHARAVLIDDHERLVDERGQQVEDRQGLQSGARADFLDGVERPAAREHGQAAEQHPLVVAQQLVTQSTDARRVCWRGIADRAPPVSKRKRSPSPAAICSIPSTRTRAAASSIASGIPSRSSQIWAIGGAL